jgi:threonylcarbamoyladenosine tRNA methylthiotransferase MtaB
MIQAIQPSIATPTTPIPLTPEAQKTVGFVTLGCKTNLLESSALAEQFTTLGWQVVDASQPAALYVFNTCTVTENADAESRRLIRKAKRQNPSARIAVTGCYAQVSPQTFQTLGGVDFVIGNNFKDNLPHLVATQFANYYADLADGPLMLVDDFEKSRELVASTASHAGIARTRGSLKIQDGCDYKCTYCIIWKGRGPSRSLPVAEVVAQVQQMVDAGFKDISLTGINIGQYQDGSIDLPQLLQAIINTVQGETYRLRLTSLDPLEVTDALMETMANSNGKIAPHVHLSTQSANDAVLKAMARRHHVEELIYVCNRLQALMPDICIGSDVIVGFPTETDEAFEDSLQVIAQLPMHYIHVFRYSPRQGTPAATMKPQVQESKRKTRATRLIELANHKRLAFYQQFAGRTFPLLLESVQPDGSLEGITPNYLRLRVSAELVKQHELAPNQLVAVTVGSLLPSGDCAIVDTIIQP